MSETPSSQQKPSETAKKIRKDLLSAGTLVAALATPNVGGAWGIKDIGDAIEMFKNKGTPPAEQTVPAPSCTKNGWINRCPKNEQPVPPPPPVHTPVAAPAPAPAKRTGPYSHLRECANYNKGNTANAHPMCSIGNEAFSAHDTTRKWTPSNSENVATLVPDDLSSLRGLRQHLGDGSAGLDGIPVNLNHNNIPHEGAKAAYEQMKKAFNSFKDYEGTDAFVVIYNSNASLTEQKIIQKQAQFEQAIAAIDELAPPAKAEVLGRIVRDIKEMDDGSSERANTMEAIRGIFNMFPQAKRVGVIFTERLPGADPRSTRPSYGGMKAYLKLPTVNHTEIAGTEPNPLNPSRTGQGKPPDEMEQIFNNYNSQSTGMSR